MEEDKRRNKVKITIDPDLKDTEVEEECEDIFTYFYPEYIAGY